MQKINNTNLNRKDRITAFSIKAILGLDHDTLRQKWSTFAQDIETSRG